ncbi:MAG TPA: hypothetical protein VN635_01185 [Conexibacter sp.]|nr:hypothetical protein [Conexibacter sp.]
MQKPIALPRRRAFSVTSIAALLLVAAAPAAHAIRPVVKINGSASLTHLAGGALAPAKFHVDTTFTTDTPGAQPFTIQRAVLYFPDHAGTNGRLFPSCNARQITHFHGNLKRCPKGAEVGRGTVTASAIQLGVTATGQVALFNSNHGKSITIHVRTLVPVLIDRSFDAPITQLHGRYGEKLTLVVPQSLQEIIGGVFVAVRDFNVTLTGAVRVHGVEYSYLKAPRCPRTPLHGVFDFMDWTSGQTATTTVDSKIHCTVR